LKLFEVMEELEQQPVSTELESAIRTSQFDFAELGHLIASFVKASSLQDCIAMASDAQILSALRKLLPDFSESFLWKLISHTEISDIFAEKLFQLFGGINGRSND
jgi:hypothetical protein